MNRQLESTICKIQFNSFCCLIPEDASSCQRGDEHTFLHEETAYWATSVTTDSGCKGSEDMEAPGTACDGPWPRAFLLLLDYPAPSSASRERHGQNRSTIAETIGLGKTNSS
ncbi:hypothetical protein AV530_006597 [Patagioenas fasciata monilis]|uniref:Uncharacterized protein n=1 Tax=Patagioenas fasciata monilis TaxID=372326 RepID=A0A1V4KH19_PATFA|nr:hypothetical protein AV530_006597 [Patagioenas fasciata monilis]